MSVGRQQQRIDRAPIRRSVSATAKVTEPPSAAVVKKKPKRKPLPETKRCGLLVLNFDGENSFAYKAGLANGAWSTTEIGDVDVMAESQVINKGRRISYPGNLQFFISADRGATWTARDLPHASDSIIPHDRSPSGRYWTAIAETGLVYYSDDEMVSWSSSGSALSISNLYYVSADPKASDRVAVSHDNLASSELQVTVTTDGGSSWSLRTVGAYGEGVALYLPNGRLVVLALDSSGKSLCGLYSDDDGATFSSATLLTSVSGANFLRLVDYRVTAQGTVFAALDNGNTDTNVNILRSTDGENWDLLSPLDSSDVSALAYCDGTGKLYVVHQGVGVYAVPRARGLDAGSWVSSAALLSNAPSGAYASNVFAGYMVTI